MRRRWWRRRSVVLRVRFTSFAHFWWHGWYIIPATCVPLWIGLALLPGAVWVRALYLVGACWGAWQATIAARRRWRWQQGYMARNDELAGDVLVRIATLDALLAAEPDMDPEVRRMGLEVRQGWVDLLAQTRAERVRIKPWSDDPSDWLRPA